MAGRYNFKCIKGDDFTRQITWTDKTPTPINLTGCSISMDLLANNSPGAEVFASLSTDNGRITITNAVGGEFSLDVLGALSDTFNFRTAWYKIVITFPDLRRVTLLYGLFNTHLSAVETVGGDSTDDAIITVDGDNVSIATIGTQGPPGSGSGGLSAVAGATISVESVVILSGGLLYPADPTNLDHAGRVVGVATQSGNTGTAINYSRDEVPGGSFSQDARYYLGLNGVLSTNPIASGAAFTQFIGYAKNVTTLSVNLGQPYAL